jgi:hypothetical protein
MKVRNIGGIMPPELSAIIKLLNYSGCACFNYKIVDGAPIIFEMNPRVGASFTRAPDQYLESYFESIRWHHRIGRASEFNAEPSAPLRSLRTNELNSW